MEEFIKSIEKFDGWTKRAMLKACSKLYDPMGYISPIIVRARGLIQNVWREKTDWDEMPGPEIQKQWLDWLKDLPLLNEITVPRWLELGEDNVTRQMHVFTDASTDAFASVIFIRVENKDGSIRTSFVTAKARVTPVRAESISRMELVACVIGTRLARAALKTLPIENDQVYYWTDSHVCLYWINSLPKAFKAYVANRASEIRRNTDASQWRHVPTADNPADVATRQISV